jgi:hypothetical protein
VNKVAERLGISTCSFIAVHIGRTLVFGSAQSLLGLGIRTGSTVHLVTRLLGKDDKQQVVQVEPVTSFNRTVSESKKPVSKMMSILVVYIDGTNFTLEFSTSAAVDDLLNKVAERLGKSTCSFYACFLEGRCLAGRPC